MDTNKHGHGHADDTGHVNPEAVKRGHEEDKIDAKSILFVPLALVATFILTYIVVSTIISYVRSPSTEPVANPVAAKRNEAPINQRFDRISSTDGKAEVQQPRLEGLQRVEGNEPPYYRSMAPTTEGNSPWYHPEDMRPSSTHGKKLGLQDYGWVNKEKKIVRLPIEEAMKIVLKQKDPKNPTRQYLSIAEKPISLESLKLTQPKASNPHWGATASEEKQVPPKKKGDKDH